MRIDKLRFLVADDHEVQRIVMRGVLETIGARDILEAADGRAALAILSKARPVDIVISDLAMPDMDGMEFLRHVGESGSRVGVIIASALDTSLIASVEAMSAAYGVNLLGALGKPVRGKDLLELISRYGTLAAEPPRAIPKFSLEEIVSGLRQGQIEAHFQPKVELAGNHTVGAEALARWRHPVHGLVEATAFAPLLEEGGGIDELMWTMLLQATSCCAQWLRLGIDATVSVNLSAKSLADVKLADRVVDAVASQGAAPRNVVLEITESAAATNLGAALENLSRLRVKGFGLSIDDFGTGYSSMQQMTRIAFTELKIDRSFVRDAPSRAANRHILESSLGMAKRLGITSVAEGVETRAEWDLLKELGCDVAQGYYVATPMDRHALLGWMLARPHR